MNLHTTNPPTGGAWELHQMADRPSNFADRCAKPNVPIEHVDPANRLRKYRRNMSAHQRLRCLQIDDAAAKKF